MESMFKNRLQKNVSAIHKWAIKNNITAYRIYDKDIPEYSYSIDRYDDSFIVYQYERGSKELRNRPDVIESDTKQLQEVLFAIQKVFSVEQDKIILKTRKKQKGHSQYEKQSQQSHELVVHEGELKFLVNLSEYLDTGLFLDHRISRQYIKKMCKDKNVLNLFAYTGSLSVAAAVGGAVKVTTVDMSNTYLSWAESNFKLNQLAVNKHEFIRADILTWIEEHIKRRQKYDVILLDPPTFSNSKKMERIFDIQSDYISLIENCKKMLSESGVLFFSCNLRNFKFDKSKFEKDFFIKDITEKTRPKDFRNKKIHYAWILERKSQLQLDVGVPPPG